MATDAWVSQYASVCSCKLSVLKLSASSCTNPVVPTRSTSVGFSAARAAQVRPKNSTVRKESPLNTMVSPSPHPNVLPARGPNLGVGGTEESQHGRAYRGRKMCDAGIIPDVHPSLSQKAGEFIEVVDANATGEGRVFLAGAPLHGHRTLQLCGNGAKPFERPVFAGAAGERMNDGVILALHGTLDARDGVTSAGGYAAHLFEAQ